VQCRLAHCEGTGLRTCWSVNGAEESEAVPVAWWGHLPAMHRMRSAQQHVSGSPADIADSPSQSSIHRGAATKHRCFHEPSQVDAGW